MKWSRSGTIQGMYPWGVCEQIRTNQLETWHPEGREALRVAYAVEEHVLEDPEAFDRLGSLLTILRMSVPLVMSALPVVILGELEEAVRRDGFEETFEALEARVGEAAGREVVSPGVLERVVEVERTREVLEGDLEEALRDVTAEDGTEIEGVVQARMLESVRGLRVLMTSDWAPAVERRDPRHQEAALLALVAVRREARKLTLG